MKNKTCPQRSSIWRPYTQPAMAQAPLQLARTEGSYLYTSDNKKIFDGISSWWLVTHGHCHPEIAAAISGAAKKIDQVVFADFTHEPAEELVEALQEILPASLKHFFFSDNGSTAVEVALKMALQCWQQRWYPSRRKFIALGSAYHGDTVGAMSVSGQGPFTRPFKNIMFEILRVAQPEFWNFVEDPFFFPESSDGTKNSVAKKDGLNAFLGELISTLENQKDEIAGLIIEPLVQGAGGMIMWPASVLQKLSTECKRHGIFLIFDEVMTGFGRTGAMFAMSRADVVPDMVCLSKGLTGGALPLSLTVTTSEIFEAFVSNDKSKTFFHGHSFTGNPISCAAAVANLKLMKQENIKVRWHEIESAHREGLKKLAQNLPIQEPRICGTIGAFNWASPAAGYLDPLPTRLMYRLLDKGLFIRPLGSVVYLMPPYSSTKSEVEWAWTTIGETLASLN